MTHLRRLEVVGTSDFPRAAADRILNEILGAVRARGTAALMLAGGSTPERVYEELARREHAPWSRVDVFFGDERSVAPDHPDSNYAMARRALLDRIPIPGHRVHRMSAEGPDLDAAAARYAELLPAAIDVLVLGIGEDGHTASLFPHAAALTASGRLVVPTRGPKPPHERLSVTPEVIRSARSCVVLAAGAAKASAVARSLEGPQDLGGCPAQLARDRIWILDRDAAELLGQAGG